MMGVAAGLAATGKVPFASSFAMFAAGRAFEQVRNSIGYPKLNVKIGATHAGISVGAVSYTHLVTRTRRLARSLTSPMQNILEASEKYPSRMVETSTLTISPSCRMMDSSGIPWQISLLMEVQTLFGLSLIHI